MSVTGSFNFNQATGQMTFTPDQVQQPVLSVQVTEHRNGQIIGSTMRDIQMVIINCSNQNPSLSGINGTPGVSADTFSTTTCANSQICFNINGADPDNNDNLTLSYNNGIPDATFTSNGPDPNVTGTFCWTPTANDIGTHNFAVTIKDDACPVFATDTRNYSITVDSGKLNITMDSSRVTCPGGSDGSASVAVSGGSGNYSFQWNTTPTITDSVITNVPAGNYRVTVSDTGTCSIVGTVTVPGPAALTTTTDSIPVSCNGQSSGQAIVNVSGGNGGFTYQWNTNPPQTSDTVSNLSAGQYRVTATDSLGCSIEDSVLVTEPPAITLATDSTVVSCHAGSDGGASVFASGGVGSFSYQWSTIPPQTDSNASNLTAGNYTVTVSDQNNCQDSAAITVTEPPPLSLSLDSIPVQCRGQSNGVAFVANVSGGNGDYGFQWNTSPSQTGDSAKGLSAGMYTVTVTDSLTCQIVDSIQVPEPPALSLTTDSIKVSCNGLSDGAAVVNASGGNGNYNYVWSTNPPQMTDSATGLQAGTYGVTVTDVKNCTDSAVTTVIEPPAMSATTDSTPVRCYGQSTGTAWVIANGGNGGYSYLWNDSLQQTNDTAANLSAGSYTVTVTDSVSCNTTASVQVTEPQPLSLQTDTTPAVCHDDSNGTASVTVTGGNGGYSYTWNTSPTQSMPTATGLSTGTYTVTVSDRKNCRDSASTFVPEPPPLSLTLDSSAVSCHNGADGTASASANGGNGNYTYQWNTSPTSFGPSISNRFAGNYTVTVTDQQNCTIIDSVTIQEPAMLQVATESTPAICKGDKNGTISAIPSGGNAGYTYEWQTNPKQTDSIATGLGAGIYNLVVTDAKGCVANATDTITEPPLLVPTTGKTDPTCHSSSDGRAWAQAQGGVGDYEFEWDANDTAQSGTVTGLKAGMYTVTVTDERGCAKTQSVVLNRPDPIQVNITPQKAEIAFGQRVKLQASALKNAETPVNFQWRPSDSLSCLNCSSTFAQPLDSMSYQVIMTDARGCLDTATATVLVNRTDKILFAPNAFTPNQDDLNDEFRLYAKGVEKYNLKIFNRWGEKLFESNRVTKGWDGTSDGELLQPGVYVYVARLTFQDGTVEQRQGSVTLIR